MRQEGFQGVEKVPQKPCLEPLERSDPLLRGLAKDFLKALLKLFFQSSCCHPVPQLTLSLRHYEEALVAAGVKEVVQEEELRGRRVLTANSTAKIGALRV